MALNKLKKSVKITILVGAVLLIGVVLYFVVNPNRSFETQSWRKSYSPSDKGPYGTYVFKELLDTNGIFSSFVEINNTLEEELEDDYEENDIYLFIGQKYHIDEDDFEYLKEFVDFGNTALISAEKLPDHVLDFFFIKLNSAYERHNDSVQVHSFTHQELTAKKYWFKYIYNNLTERTEWTYFKDNNFQYYSGDIDILGYNANQQINFISIPYGDGAFYLHTSPYNFTNISFFRNDGFEYAEDLIKHIPHGMVQWDAYNLRFHFRNNQSGSGSGSGSSGKRGEGQRSVLEFIFKHTTLTWAFFLLLFTGVFYLIFKGKRQQKIIGAIESKENSSLRYIETVSSLYLQERKHNKLVLLQKKSFIDFITNHYFIVSPKINQKYVDKIHIKSGIDKERIKAIFVSLEELSHQEVVTDIELIELQQKIEYFYKKCK